MASLATIFRQVEREGRKWGLVPLLRDGCVKVCEMVAEMRQHSIDCPVVIVKTPRVICSLNESSPVDAFAAILRSRRTRHNADILTSWNQRLRREREAAMRDAEQRQADFRAKWERLIIRQQIRSLPTGMGG